MKSIPKEKKWPPRRSNLFYELLRKLLARPSAGYGEVQINLSTAKRGKFVNPEPRAPAR